MLPQEDCLVVPTSGTMYAQVVSSDLASRWRSLRPIRDPADGSVLLGEKEQPSPSDSAVSLALHDLQLSEVKSEWFTPVTEPLEVFRFDFSGRSGPIPAEEQTVTTATALRSSDRRRCDAVFVWWDLRMDPEESVLLSCAPRWAHRKPEGMVRKRRRTHTSSGKQLIYFFFF